MLPRCLPAHRKRNGTKDASIFHFIIFLTLQKLDFLVFLGCYNKMPQTEWLINNRNLLLAVLETGSFKVKAPARSCFGEGPLPGCRLPVIASHGGRAGSSLGPPL